MANKGTEKRIKDLEKRLADVEINMIQLRTALRLLSGAFQRLKKKGKE